VRRAQPEALPEAEEGIRIARKCRNLNLLSESKHNENLLGRFKKRSSGLIIWKKGTGWVPIKIYAGGPDGKNEEGNLTTGTGGKRNRKANFS